MRTPDRDRLRSKASRADQPLLHEEAERIGLVVAEGRNFDEAGAAIKADSRRLMDAGFEAQRSDAAPTGVPRL